jgi:succinate dehydrogenase/fumarate reductase flavoprotein subunit
VKLERQSFDVIVVGSGMSGVTAANHAKSTGARVLLVSKDPVIASDSKISEGIITVRASGSDDDSTAEFADNVIESSANLGNPEIARTFAEKNQDAYQWLRQNGLRPNLNPENDKPIPFGVPMGGHSQPRSVKHNHGGVEHSHSLWQAALSDQAISYMEDAWFLDLYRSDNDDGRVLGGLVYHAAEGCFISVMAPAVILAAGGLNTLYYPNTDTMKGNSGDAYAIAARAGARLVDMEQVQFIPFAVAAPGSNQGLVVGEPFSGGALGVLKDKDGNVIMSEIMAKTRAECAAAVAVAVSEGKGTPNEACYLDLTPNIKGRSGELFKAIMWNNFPSIMDTVKRGLGRAEARFEAPWEIKPSAHYCMGGIDATEEARVQDQNGSIIPGLFVAGQALGGLHGGNRLGSTSLAECLVFGSIAGSQAGTFARSASAVGEADVAVAEKETFDFYERRFGQGGDTWSIRVLRQLQAVAWEGVGPARNAEGIDRVRETTKALQAQNEAANISDDEIWNQSFIDYVECRNMLSCAEMVSSASAERPKSLGAHVRLDEDPTAPAEEHYSTSSQLVEGVIVTRRVPRPPLAPEQWKSQRRTREATLEKFRNIAAMSEEEREPLLTGMYEVLAGEAS